MTEQDLDNLIDLYCELDDESAEELIELFLED